MGQYLTQDVKEDDDDKILSPLHDLKAIFYVCIRHKYLVEINDWFILLYLDFFTCQKKEMVGLDQFLTWLGGEVWEMWMDYFILSLLPTSLKILIASIIAGKGEYAER